MAVIREIVVREDIAVDSLSFERNLRLGWGLETSSLDEKPFCQIDLATD
jgi:hypothetical protein